MLGGRGLIARFAALLGFAAVAPPAERMPPQIRPDPPAPPGPTRIRAEQLSKVMYPHAGGTSCPECYGLGGRNGARCCGCGRRRPRKLCRRLAPRLYGRK